MQTVKRLTRTQIHDMYELVAARDGFVCFVGGESGCEGPLYLDWWDCNPENINQGNFRLLCLDSKLAKYPIQKRLKVPSIYHNMCEKMGVRADETPKTTSLEFIKSMKAEPAFCHFLFREVVSREEVPFDEMLNSGSAVARISQVTARRYIAKETSPVRLYQIVQTGGEKLIRFRPEWERFRAVVAERRKLDREARNWKKELLDGLPISSSGQGEKSSGKKADTG